MLDKSLLTYFIGRRRVDQGTLHCTDKDTRGYEDSQDDWRHGARWA